MPTIELEHRTQLSASEIMEKAETLIPDALKEYGDQISDPYQEWKGNTLVFSFKAMGFFVSGEATASNNLIKIKAKLPLVAGMFKGKIRDKFHEEAKKLFP
ncbi:polyhydroxyalkanoic acid system family protein [Candidatus Woesearchaeota archaeon]|nr:polyhydroxyalkanoic acid system family protein [Candidatus Woesearchaeota archaeon]